MKKILLLLCCFFIQSVYAQTLEFSYRWGSTRYYYPEAKLIKDGENLTIKFFGESSYTGICRREATPKLTVEFDSLILFLGPAIVGCEEIRFSFSKDGASAEGQFYSGNKWIPFDKISNIKIKNPKQVNDFYNEIFSKNQTENQPKQKNPQENPAPRAAAIGNVDVSVKAPVGQGVNGQPTQLTTNPIDQQKKTSNNEIWVSFNPSITVQERQFCRIIENFRVEKTIAEQSKNQIKINETFKSLVQSLNSLLPDGKFQGWIMRTVFVAQASDGSAEVLLELPCNVYVGSNACDADPQKFYGTAPEGTRMYTELAKMSVGDFVLTSGQFVYVDDKAFEKNRSVASFRYLKTASHCRAKEMPADTDFFGLKLDVISTMK